MMLLIICFSGILMAGRQSYNNIIQFLSGGMYQKKRFKKPAHADIKVRNMPPKWTAPTIL